MKFIRYGNQIISLQDVLEVRLNESESQHTRNGTKYVDKHYSIRIDYTHGKWVTIYLPDNDATAARCLFQAIYDELNAD